jgi:phosphoribosylamine--glycine ligase/phosphoribosylformylglycinamidine cyclo-ligase
MLSRSGAVHGGELLPFLDAMQDGDVLIALRSSGLHSNGYSLVRRCAELGGMKYSDPPPFDSPHATLGDALLVPTRIYVRDLLPLLRRRLLKGMAHITGGGILGNLPRILPPHLRAVLNLTQSEWSLPPVFRWLQQVANLSQQELLRTFNCGVGMVLVVDRSLVPEVMAQLATSPCAPFVVGALRARPRPHMQHLVGALVQGEPEGEDEAAQVVVVGTLK